MNAIQRLAFDSMRRGQLPVPFLDELLGLRGIKVPTADEADRRILLEDALRKVRPMNDKYRESIAAADFDGAALAAEQALALAEGLT